MTDKKKTTEDVVQETAPMEPVEATESAAAPKKKISRGKIAGIAVAAAAVVVVAAGAAFALSGGQEAEVAQLAPQQEPATAAPEVREADPGMLALEADAEGWDETSTPVIAHIESTDGEVDFYTAFPANEPVEVTAEGIEEGEELTVTYTSPINADGGIYEVPEPATVRAVAAPEPEDAAEASGSAAEPANDAANDAVEEAGTTTAAGDTSSATDDADSSVSGNDTAATESSADDATSGSTDAAAGTGDSAAAGSDDAPEPIEPEVVVLAPVDPKDVTQDELDAILDEIAEAVSKGDSTLAGDAAEAVIDQAAQNAAANPNADEKKVEEKAAEAEKAAETAGPAVESGTTATPAAKPSSSSGSSSSSSSASSSSGSSASSSKPASSASSSSGSASSGSASSGASSSSGSASKPAHTHSWTPVTEKKWVSKMVTVTDQAAWTETYEVDVCACGFEAATQSEMMAHVSACARDGREHAGRVETRTINHPAVTHQEDQGHYETVTTGYVCSGCGATK